MEEENRGEEKRISSLILVQAIGGSQRILLKTDKLDSKRLPLKIETKNIFKRYKYKNKIPNLLKYQKKLKIKKSKENMYIKICKYNPPSSYKMMTKLTPNKSFLSIYMNGLNSLFLRKIFSI